MMGRVVSTCARVIAAGTAVILAVAASRYVSSGEVWSPYVLIIAVWLALFTSVDFWMTRWAKRARAGRLSRLFSPLTCLVLAVVGASLAVLSLEMASRYAMSSELMRRLDRAAKRDSVGKPPSIEVAFYTTDHPELPRLIFIHGTPGHAGVFANYLLDPVPGFETIAVDRPGFGRSGWSGPVVSFEEQAQALSALLVRQHGQWPILVGHSLGGPIVARIAADFPDRVRGIVILAGSLDPMLESPSWYNDVTSAPIVDAKMPDMYETANAEIAGAHEQTVKLASVLDRIRCPVEVVHGTADTLVPVANVAFIKKAMANSPHVGVRLIEGEGHGIHRLRGNEVRDAIGRLVDATATSETK